MRTIPTGILPYSHLAGGGAHLYPALPAGSLLGGRGAPSNSRANPGGLYRCALGASKRRAYHGVSPGILAQKERCSMARYFTKALLMEAANRGPEWDYNRQLDPDALGGLDPNARFPIVFLLNHFYRAGVPCEPHIRCGVEVEGPSGPVAFVDVPVEFFERLPKEVDHGTAA